MNKRAASETRFERSSDDSLLVYFDDPSRRAAQAKARGGRISIAANEKVRKLLQLLQAQPINGLRNLHPGYCSLLVKFNAVKLRHEDIEEKLGGYLQRLDSVRLPAPRSVEIPVCYGGQYGPDLSDVAEIHGMTREQVIDLHSSTTYLVYFLGFVPGFAYLGELPERLATPRLATPRRKVPAGSVGIAGSQTAVYALETPGGWRLLGRTPLAMFDTKRDGLSLLSIGDRVTFTPITDRQFEAMSQSQAQSAFNTKTRA